MNRAKVEKHLPYSANTSAVANMLLEDGNHNQQSITSIIIIAIIVNSNDNTNNDNDDDNDKPEQHE